MRISPQFVRFLFAGGLAATVNVGSRIVFNLWTSYSVAIVLAFMAGLTTGFLLNRTYVFPNGRNSPARSAFFFVLVNLLALLQTWVISILLAEYALPGLGVQHFTHEIAHVVGVAVPLFTSYVGHKQWSFR